jgi:opacity protein-like surface antigen
VRNIRLPAIALLLISVMPRAVEAQSAGRVDGAGGYSWLRDHDAEATFTHGWFASIGTNLIGPLGIVGDASSSYESQRGPDVEFSMSMLSVLIQTRRVSPFAQMLFGTVRSSTKYRLPNDTLGDSKYFFGWQAGGGVDVELVNHVALRLGAHYRMIPTETFTPNGSRPWTIRETQWFTGVAVR